jgi:ADP-ribose pyrophosphatase YjhB (NUDIX family)
MFNPDRSLFLVGKESKWVSDIDSLTAGDKAFLRATFSRASADRVRHDDPAEIAYYIGQIPLLEANASIMAEVTRLAESPRLTFGDIENRDGITYTKPRFLPREKPYKFPGGGMKAGTDASLYDTAVREFREESGIDLTQAPFDLAKLIDTGMVSDGYQVFHYTTDAGEFAAAQAAIAAKNIDANAELHDLRFLSTQRQIKNSARTQYTKTPAGTPRARYVPPGKRGGRRLRSTRSIRSIRSTRRLRKKTKRTKQRCRQTRK